MSFDLDQARHFVGPDQDPTCLQKRSTDENESIHCEQAKGFILAVHFTLEPFSGLDAILLGVRK